MKRLLLLLLCLALPTWAARTTITGTLKRADGQVLTGTAYVSWPSYTAGGAFIPAGSMSVPISKGALSVSLEPNSTANANPGGWVYTVRYQTGPNQVTVEYWAVPVSAFPVDIGTVRNSSYTAPIATFSPSLLATGGCIVGQALVFDGAVFNCSSALGVFVRATVGNTFTGGRQVFTPGSTYAGLRIVPGALPSSPLQGDIAVDTNGALNVWSGSNWKGVEASITPGTTAQYYRGDKTWQALNTDNVPETASHLYYSDARSRSALSVTAPLGYNSATGAFTFAWTKAGNSTILATALGPFTVGHYAVYDANGNLVDGGPGGAGGGNVIGAPSSSLNAVFSAADTTGKTLQATPATVNPSTGAGVFPGGVSVGSGQGLITIQHGTAPASPAANNYTLYVDSADSHLKVKKSDGNVIDLHRGVVSVMDYGCVGDGVADDTACIRAALEAANGLAAGTWETGGDATTPARKRVPLFFPAGKYRTTSTIHIRYTGVSLFGPTGSYDGGQPYSGYTAQIVGDHNGDVFNIDSATYNPYYTSFDGIYLAKSVAQANTGNCLSVTGANWVTDVAFVRSSARSCNNGIYISTGAQSTIGRVTVDRSMLTANANYGFYSVQGLTTGLITRSSISQNSVGGIYTAAKGVNISDNDLEGQPAALTITGSNNTAAQIRNNYFELNTGNAAIFLYLLSSFTVEGNQWGANVNIPHVAAVYCRDGVIREDTVHLVGSYNVSYKSTAIGAYATNIGIATNVNTSRAGWRDGGVPATSSAIVPTVASGKVPVKIVNSTYLSYLFTSAARLLTQPATFAYSTNDYIGLTFAIKYTGTLPPVNSHAIMVQPNYHVSGGAWITSPVFSPSTQINAGDVAAGDTMFYTYFWQVTDTGPNFDQFRAYIYAFGNAVGDTGSGAYLTDLYLWKQTGSTFSEVNPLPLVASALNTTAPGGNVESCATYTLGNNGTNWTVAVNGGTAVAGAAIAAATSQSVALFSLPAGGFLTGRIVSKTSTAWSGSGFTSFTSTIGDSVGGATKYTSSTYDMAAAVGDTNFQDTAPAAGLSTFAGSTVNAVITANQNLNTSAITGATDYRICWAAN